VSLIATRATSGECGAGYRNGKTPERQNVFDRFHHWFLWLSASRFLFYLVELDYAKEISDARKKSNNLPNVPVRQQNIVEYITNIIRKQCNLCSILYVLKYCFKNNFLFAILIEPVRRAAGGDRGVPLSVLKVRQQGKHR
jgi:hypothetical protein